MSVATTTTKRMLSIAAVVGTTTELASPGALAQRLKEGNTRASIRHILNRSRQLQTNSGSDQCVSVGCLPLRHLTTPNTKQRFVFCAAP